MIKRIISICLIAVFVMVSGSIVLAAGETLPFSDNFETGYYSDGRDAAPQLWAKWSGVETKADKEAFMQVHKIDNSNVLKMGAYMVETTAAGSDPYIEMGGSGVDFGDNFTVKFRLKNATAVKNQFKVTIKDSNGNWLDMLMIDNNSRVYCLGSVLDGVLLDASNWVNITIDMDTVNKVWKLSADGRVIAEKNVSSILPANANFASAKLRFSNWIWAKNEEVAYYIDDVDIRQTDSSGGEEPEEPENPEYETDENLFADDFETNYNANGSDATGQLWKNWTYVDSKGTKGGILQVHSNGGSNRLLIGAERSADESSEGTDALIEREGLQISDVSRISFELEPYSSRQDAFKVIMKDAAGAFYDVMLINDKGKVTAFGKETEFVFREKTEFKIILDKAKKKATVTANGETVLDNYDFSGSLPSGYDMSKVRIRFSTWIWTKGATVGYWLDNISVDTLKKSGGEEPENPEEAYLKLTSPLNGSTYGIGEIELSALAYTPNGEVIKKVEFYVNSEIVGEVSKEPYTIKWMPAEKGRYEIYAVAYDNDNTAYETEKATVVISDIITNEFEKYDFEEYSGKQGYQTISGWQLIENKGTTFNAESSDEQHGSSLVIATQTANTNYGGGYALHSIPASKNAGKFSVEGDFWFDNGYGKEIALFNLKSDSAQWNKTLLVASGYLQYPYMNDAGATKFQNVLPIENEKWYNIKVNYDLHRRVFDVYVDGVLMVNQQDMYNKSIIPTEDITCRYTLDTLTTGGVFAVDNIKVTFYYDYPQVTSLRFVNGSGEYTDNAGSDTAEIHVKFNQAMEESLMTSENIELYQGDETIKLNETGKYISAENTYAIKLSGRLKPSMEYTVKVSDALKSALSGVYMDGVSVYKFITNGSGVYTDEVVVKVNGAVCTNRNFKADDKIEISAHIANNTPAEKRVTLRIGLYCGNTLYKMVSTTADIPVGGKSIAAPAVIWPETAQEFTVTGYLCDEFKPMGAVIEIK